jgi:uncharacterized protein (DUF58 family)
MSVHKRIYFFILIILFSFIGWVITLDYLLFGLWTAGIILIGWAYVLTKISLNCIALKRYSRVIRIPVGSIFTERLEITNLSRHTKLWLRIDDQSGILSRIHSRAIANLGAGKIRIHQVKAVINQRGFYQLGPTRVSSGDPLGIFSTSKLFPAQSQLVAYPYIDRLSSLKLDSGIETSGQNLLAQSTQTTPQAAGVREFQPGDPLKRIHWPITLRKEHLMVKEFDEDTQTSIWLILDAHKGKYPHLELEAEPAVDWNFLPINKKQPYQLPRDGFEYAVSIAASLAEYYIRTKRAVGFASYGRQLVILPAEKGQRQLHKILNQLAAIEDTGTIPIQALMERQIKNIPRGSTLILISPLPYNKLITSVQHALRWGMRAQVIQIETNSFLSPKSTGTIPDLSIKNLIRISYGDEISVKLAKAQNSSVRTRGSAGSLPKQSPLV